MQIVKKIIIYFIKLYQTFISPLLGQCCCFYPTCSNYMIDALNKYGCIKGIYLGCKRLIRCHPGSECKVDEVQ